MKSTILKTYAPWQGAEGEETQLFIARNGEQAPADFPGQLFLMDAGEEWKQMKQEQWEK